MPINKHMPERRLESRLLCADMVEVHWKDRSGWKRQSTAMLEDISPSGACLQFEVPVPLNTTLRIRYAKGRLEGHVRYCSYRDMSYWVGLEFAPEARWSEQSFRPKHLLDMQKLLARKPRKHPENVESDKELG